MLEGASFLLDVFAFAMLQAAAEGRPRALRLVACGAWALSFWFSCLAQGGAGGTVLFVFSCAVSACAFVFGAPVARRLTWGVAVLSPLAALVLVVLWRLRAHP